MTEDELIADAAKAAGDAAFRSGLYEAAIAHYSQGISFDPNAAVLYSKRSAAHLKVSRMQEALDDFEMCISLGTAGAKILARKATALQALERYSEALAVWNEVYHLDENFDCLERGMNACQEAIAGQDMLNLNALFTKKDAYTLLGGFRQVRFEGFDQALCDDFLSTFIQLPGKPEPSPDASQKVHFIMTAMIAQEIPSHHRNESNMNVQVRGHYCLPRGAFERMKEDKAFAAKVCDRAFFVFITEVYKRSIQTKCVHCSNPSLHFLVDMSIKSLDSNPGCKIDVMNMFFLCGDPKCEAVGRRVSERSADFETIRCCAGCGEAEGPSQLFRVCSRCKIVHYCSKGCQLSDWKEHKPVCKAASRKSTK